MLPPSSLLLVASLLAGANADGIYTKKSPVLQLNQKTYGSLIANSNYTSVRLLSIFFLFGGFFLLFFLLIGLSTNHPSFCIDRRVSSPRILQLCSKSLPTNSTTLLPQQILCSLVRSLPELETSL
jgi:hypothetical protein